MAAYLKFTGGSTPINGDQDPSVTLPTGQPNGFGVAQSFTAEGFQWGITSATIFATGSGAGAGKSSPANTYVALNGVPPAPLLFGAAAAGVSWPRVCFTYLANATGGVATPWVQSYVLMRDVSVGLFQGDSGGDRPSLSLTFNYSALLYAAFDLPSGGVLGARTMSGWDWKNNQTWDGS